MKYSWKLDRNEIYYYNGLLVTFQDPGNIHYGYVGSALHTLTDLHIAAGAYQIYSGTSDWSFWNSYFDDPMDGGAITYGYLLKHGYYDYGYTIITLK